MADPRKIDIQPGALHLSHCPVIMRTILGSCVSVSFWCERLGAGALCHGILPRCPKGASLPEGHRYVDSSIRYLAKRFDALGAHRQEVEIKIFGGADALFATKTNGKPTVGMLNCEAAQEVLEEEGYTVRASDLGGIRGRRILFDTATGEVLVHLLAAWHAPDKEPPVRTEIRKGGL